MVTLSTHPNGTAGYCLYVDGAQKGCLAAGAQRSGAQPGSWRSNEGRSEAGGSRALPGRGPR